MKKSMHFCKYRHDSFYVLVTELDIVTPLCYTGYSPKGWQGETPKLTTEYPFGWVATKTLPILTAKKLLLAENVPEAEPLRKGWGQKP